MPVAPSTKRTCAFFDGQNLFHAAREAFGCRYPDFDPLPLANAICVAKGWQLDETYFYTGVPDAGDNAFWNHFWNAKLAVMGTRGIHTFTRALRYRNQSTDCHKCGATTTVLVGQEKGIDVRLALDVVRLARAQRFDVGLIFSQDQDLSEVADEVRAISIAEDRWLKLACAFPSSPTSRNRRGINGTEWIKLDRATYARSLDPNDYRPKRKTK